MNSGKLGKKLAKEFARHRGKTIALVLLFGVAIYMWAPIVTGSSKKKKSTASKATAAPVTTVSASTTPDVPVVVNHEISFEWEDFLVALEHDDKMKPRQLEVLVRDPFIPIAPPEPPRSAATTTDEPVESASVESVPDVTPEQLGLALRATFVGRVTKSANINGISYSLGDEIIGRGADDASAGAEPVEAITFRLVDVTEASAMLERNGEVYRLNLPVTNTESSGNIVIRAATPAR